MTREEVLRLADKHSTLTAGWMFSARDMENFYKHAYEAGAAAEREACAKRCERVADDYIAANGRHAAAIAYECAVAIRATGEKP